MNFLDMTPQEQQLLIKDAIKCAFDNDDSINQGNIIDTCDEQTKGYYLGLANGDKKAIEKKQNMLKEFIRDTK